jgi:hypothetical protein
MRKRRRLTSKRRDPVGTHAIYVCAAMLADIGAATHVRFFDELENLLNRKGYRLNIIQRGLHDRLIQIVKGALDVQE